MGQHSPQDEALLYDERDRSSSSEPRLTKLLLILAPLLVVLIIGAVLLWPRIFISIPPGQAGVVFRFFTGTQTDYVYPAGLHIIPPWDTMNFYEIRNQITMHRFHVLSERGLEVELEIAIRYRPVIQQLGLLHQRIGPDYAFRVLVPQAESVLRRQLSAATAEGIYTNADGLLDNAVNLARRELGRNYVNSEDVVIRTVTLPTQIKAAIEDKLTQRELLQSYAFRLSAAAQEADRLRDEARGIRDYQARIDSTLNDRLLQQTGIRATREIAGSENSSVILIGSGKDGLPMIPGGR
jgi:regulator of protease activity HflC (stomatin/prohibitin superfamily)